MVRKCLDQLINLKLKQEPFWNKYSKKNISFWIKGYVYSHTIDELINKFLIIKKNEISSFIKSIDGHFAIIVKRDDLTLLIVDKIRSTPLYFTKINSELFVDYDPKNLVNLSNFDKTLDYSAKLEIEMSGFTIGNKTIYKNLYSLKAGEIVLLQNNNFQYIQYYKYFGITVEKEHSKYLEELSETTLKIFQKMLNQIGNRQIIIPLSAGNDSRLVASILKHLGATNVKCFSYGTPGNFEAEISKVIAKKLGFEWKFIPFNHTQEKKYYKSLEYKNFLDFSETYCSSPYIQGLSSIKYLKEKNWADKDAIFINGNSGDFITGGHINFRIKENIDIDNKQLRKENILNQLIEKHFSLWSYLKTDSNISKLKKSLWKEIITICTDLKNQNEDHLFYEYSEFIDRQCYVITGQKIYEYYGYDWRLPLWDDEYLFFWQKVPLNLKLKQKLYIEMLKKNNFGNVWGAEIPINKKTITPKWIIPFRFISKIPFGFFGKRGKKVWKQFDINFFYYWIDITHMMKSISYFRVISSFFKGPRNSISWQTEDYLSKFISKE